MPFLVAAVVLVGVICLLDLVLTLAVIRRLRDHTGRLDRLSHGAPEGAGMLSAGARVPDFAGLTTTGVAVTHKDVSPGVIAFLSVTCDACKEQLPVFTQYVADAGLSADQVLAVVTGADSPDRDALVASLDGVTVVAEEFGGPVGRAFGASVFPAFYSVDDGGEVRTASLDAAGLTESPKPSIVSIPSVT